MIIQSRLSVSRSRGPDDLGRPGLSAGVHGRPALLFATALARSDALRVGFLAQASVVMRAVEGSFGARQGHT